MQQDPDYPFSEHETRVVKRAITLASAGKDGKAARALMQQQLPDPEDPHVQAAIAKAHPPNPDPYTGHPDIPATAIVDPEEFGKTHLKPMCTLSAADVYGWTAEILRAIWPNKACREASSRIIEREANNQFTPTERALATVSMIIPINKPSASANPIRPEIIGKPVESDPPSRPQSQPTVPGVRSINVGSLFTKAASRNQHALITPEAIASVCPMPQFAEGRSGGSAAAVARQQAFCDLTIKKNTPQLILLTDVINAFASQSRKEMVTGAIDKPPIAPIHNLTLFSLGGSALVVTKKNGMICQVGVSEQGSRAGERDAGTVFCVSMARHYAAALESPPLVDGIALTDEFALHGGGDPSFRSV